VLFRDRRRAGGEFAALRSRSAGHFPSSIPSADRRRFQSFVFETRSCSSAEVPRSRIVWMCSTLCASPGRPPRRQRIQQLQDQISRRHFLLLTKSIIMPSAPAHPRATVLLISMRRYKRKPRFFIKQFSEFGTNGLKQRGDSRRCRPRGWECRDAKLQRRKNGCGRQSTKSSAVVNAAVLTNRSRTLKPRIGIEVIGMSVRGNWLENFRTIGLQTGVVTHQKGDEVVRARMCAETSATHS